MGEGARARAGGAPPVPERRGQEARAGAGAQRAPHVPFAPTATLPAEGIGRAAATEVFRGGPPVAVTPGPADGEFEPNAIHIVGLSQRSSFVIGIARVERH